MEAIPYVAALASSASDHSAATYNLFDHPECTKADKPTLRLPPEMCEGGADYWSFEAQDGGSLAILNVDLKEGTGTVVGTMRHGLDQSLWQLNLNLFGVVPLDGVGGGRGSFGATGYTGSLQNADGSVVFNLMGKGKIVDGSVYEWTCLSQTPGGGADWQAPNLAAGWISSLQGEPGTCSNADAFTGVLAAVTVPSAGFLLIGSLGGLAFAARRSLA